MSESVHIKTRQYETLHNDPQIKWCWTIVDGDDEVIDYQDDFDSESEALSHGECVLRNLREDRAAVPDAPRYMRQARAVIAAYESALWQDISSADRGSDGDTIGPCLFGKKHTWGWEIWSGQLDCGQWLGIAGDGTCYECDEPTHFRPLPTPPKDAGNGK